MFDPENLSCDTDCQVLLYFGSCDVYNRSIITIKYVKMLTKVRNKAYYSTMSYNLKNKDILEN